MGIRTRLAKGVVVSCLALCGVDLTSEVYVSTKRAVEVELSEKFNSGFARVARAMGYAPAPVYDEKTARQKVIKAAVRNGINPDLALALWRVESRGDQFAVSPAGAIGHMQIMPVNAVKLCGYKHSAELYDEDKNINCGVRFLAQLLRDYNWNVPNALRAYNGGPRCANGGCKESDQYVRLVLAELAKNVVSET